MTNSETSATVPLIRTSKTYAAKFKQWSLTLTASPLFMALGIGLMRQLDDAKSLLTQIKSPASWAFWV
jgi:hypothetical protein